MCSFVYLGCHTCASIPPTATSQRVYSWQDSQPRSSPTASTCWSDQTAGNKSWLITSTNKRKGAHTFPYFKQAVVHFRTVTMKQLKKYHELWFQMLLSYNRMFFEFYERESHCRCALHINRGDNITAFIHIKLPLLSGVIWLWIYQRWSAGCWYQFACHHWEMFQLLLLLNLQWLPRPPHIFIVIKSSQ